ncbi:AAA family ATPase [Halomonas maura]|uniref:AAA family ATPase n=1 Tax=Halomonas maura TaxID=117606 RepID=UPI0025B588DB|nr:AAA family ATPase [Halomonas maura]MDN3554618.1 AAA family ATPase [Halomonas maura]
MTPVEKIAHWVEGKPVWWKHAVRLSLYNETLGREELDEILQVARVESGLYEEAELSDDVKSKLDVKGYESESEKVTVRSISNVVNVGALAEDQELKFSSPNLNIVYGDNGTGKSTYANILKNVCLSRGGARKVIGNVFEESPHSPSSLFKVNVAGEDLEVQWQVGFESDERLKSVRVFDSSSSEHFVAKEDELGYKPFGLSLLEDLAEAVDHVKRNVHEEIMPGNGFSVLPRI